MGVLGLGAVLFLWFGFRPRRRGETPYCRACGYNLTGAVTARCTECGADLGAKRAVVLGERRRRPWLIAVGCLFALATLGGTTLLAVRAAATIDLYRYVPLWWVVGDLEQGTVAEKTRSLKELERRWTLSKLSKDDCGTFIETLLAEQQGSSRTPGVTDKAINLLGAIIAAGDATEEQAERFLSNLVHLELRTRPKILAGRGVPYEIVSYGACPEIGFEAVVSTGDVVIDGQQDGVRSSSTFIVNGAHSKGTRSGTEPVPDGLGRHEATCDVKVEVYPIGSASVVGIGAERKEQPLRIYQRRLSSFFEVVESEPPDAFRTRSDAALDAEMRSRLTLAGVRLERGTPDDPLRISAQVNADAGLPIAIAAELIADFDDGRSLSIGFVRLPPDANGHNLTVGASCPGPRPQRVTVRLVPSREAAATSVDIQEFWGGSVHFGEFELAPPSGNE